MSVKASWRLVALAAALVALAVLWFFLDGPRREEEPSVRLVCTYIGPAKYGLLIQHATGGLTFSDADGRLWHIDTSRPEHDTIGELLEAVNASEHWRCTAQAYLPGAR